MKRALAAIWLLAAALLPGDVSAQTESVGRFVCERQSGGPASSFAMTIDFDAKSVDVPSQTGIEPDPDSIEITGTTVRWSFMRGYVVFFRKTGELDWDATSEYAYLEDIDQPSDEPESNFKGQMTCKADREHPPP